MEPSTPAPAVLNPLEIDEYCAVRSQREALAAREKLLKAKLDACIPPDLAPDHKWTFNGEAYVLAVSARDWERTFKSLGRLYRRLGHKAFFTHCKFNLGDFDRLVPEADRPSFITREQSGPRKFTVVQKFTIPA